MKKIKKYILLAFWWTPNRLQIFVHPANLELIEMTSHLHNLVEISTVSNCWHPKSLFGDEFLQDKGSLEAETSVSGKT